MIEIPLLKIIVAFLTISVRITGLLLFAPFFGSISVSPQIKAALAIVFTVLLYPIVSRRVMALEIAHWPTVVLGELLIGAAMGIATNLVFDAVQMAGQVLSVQMGFSLVTLLDPQTQADSTVVAMFHQTIAMLIFLRMDVHLWLLGAIGRSFELLPPGTMHLSAAFAMLAVHAGGEVFVLGLQMAAPVFSATLLTDLAIGLLGRASPNMPLMLLGPPVKMLVGLAVLFAALKYWPSMLARFFESSMNLSNHLLLLAR